MTRLGANDDFVYETNDDDDDETIPDEARRPAKGGRRGLSHFLLLLSQLGDKLTPKTIELALYFCALMLIDDDIAVNLELGFKVRRTVIDLLNAATETALPQITTAFAKRLHVRLDNPLLMSRLLMRLPHDSLRPHILRTQLAYSYVVGGDVPGPAILTSPSTWRTLLKSLQKPDFAITDRTDYALLGARMFILDTAIAPGFGVHEITLPAPAPKPIADDSTAPPIKTNPRANITSADDEDAQVNGDSVPANDTPVQTDGEANTAASKPKPSLFFRPKAAPTPLSDKEKAFNAEVDAMVRWLRKTASSIRDAGAAHVRRTECKGVIERMAVRIESTVRTRRVKKASVFGMGRA